MSNKNKHAERAKSAPSTAYDDSPMDTDDVPSTSGGELSMSVEETNKLRIAMGLKPLNVEDKATKEKEQQKKREEAEKEAKTLEIQARIDKAKKDREKNKKIAGKSLGEELAGEEEDDTVSWVLKSRQLEEERKLAEKRSKTFEELDKGGSDDEGPRRSSKSGSAQATAKGLKVAHGIEDILDTNADSIILTLKDTPILDKYNLNEDDDELENLQLVEKEKLKLYEARKKKKPVYDAHDEEKKNILPQYDDDVETKHKKSFVIDDSTINVYQKRVEEEAQKVMEGRKFVQYNLEMDKTFANEYMTQEEAAVKFKKTKKKTTVKKKKLRQKDESETAVSDVNNNAREGNNIIIEDSMDIAPTQEGRKDHGSRNASVKLARDAQKAQNDAERRQKNYEIAKQKAEEETKSLVNGRAEDDEDKALLKSLSKAREMAKPEKKSDPLAELAARVQASKQKKDVEMASTTDDPNLMFTATTEFIKNIQPDDTYFSKPKKKDKVKEAELEKEISEDLSTQEDMLRAQQAKERKLKKEQEDREMREAEERAKQEEEEEEEDEDENDEPDVGSSMTAALQFLKSRVGVEKMETFVGRKNDKTVDFDENNDPAPEINLSYIDEFGRPLTQKEAFRQLSWKFHGKKPGKNKQAKRMRQMEQEKARLKMANNDTPLMTVAKLQAEQERTQQAYVVLSGKSHGTESSYDAPKASKPPAEKGESTPAPKRPITTVAPTGSVMQGAFTEFKINAPKKPKT